ncbi:MAG: hypothetical protein OXT07_07535 [bacterium]|nr:hypothetical protein [bacterium]
MTLREAIADADEPDNRSWRPFQLAFFLLRLPSLTDPAHPERSGVPMQRVRPMLDGLQRQMGIDHALASQRLYTDGAELLFDCAEQNGIPADEDIADEERLRLSSSQDWVVFMKDARIRCNPRVPGARTLRPPPPHKSAQAQRNALGLAASTTPSPNSSSSND